MHDPRASGGRHAPARCHELDGLREALDELDRRRNDTAAAPPPERVQWHQDTCMYFGCDDVDGAYEFLKAKGIDPNPPLETSYGMRQLYFRDPDNYNLCFQKPVSK